MDGKSDGVRRRDGAADARVERARVGLRERGEVVRAADVRVVEEDLGRAVRAQPRGGRRRAGDAALRERSRSSSARAATRPTRARSARTAGAAPHAPHRARARTRGVERESGARVAGEPETNDVRV